MIPPAKHGVLQLFLHIQLFPDSSEHLSQLRNGYRLEQVVQHTVLHSALGIGKLAMPAQKHHLHRQMLFHHKLCDLQPTYAAHLDVCQDDIGHVALQICKNLLSVRELAIHLKAQFVPLD